MFDCDFVLIRIIMITGSFVTSISKENMYENKPQTYSIGDILLCYIGKNSTIIWCIRLNSLQ